tara:strand:+ start:35737 stop:36462 length:726 start_codon:yes stop_codon:yes gene_type:complete
MAFIATTSICLSSHATKFDRGWNGVYGESAVNILTRPLGYKDKAIIRVRGSRFQLDDTRNSVRYRMDLNSKDEQLFDDSYVNYQTKINPQLDGFYKNSGFKVEEVGKDGKSFSGYQFSHGEYSSIFGSVFVRFIMPLTFELQDKCDSPDLEVELGNYLEEIGQENTEENLNLLVDEFKNRRCIKLTGTMWKLDDIYTSLSEPTEASRQLAIHFFNDIVLGPVLNSLPVASVYYYPHPDGDL